MPKYPRDLPYPAWMLRVAEKFRLPLATVDEWPVDAILDEVEAIAYLSDVDNPVKRSG